jgi:prepilin-type N-terminal cleavage/methylation domain-containing protein
MRRVGKKSKGFTIVELLIVIVIIAVVAAVVITAYAGVQKRSRNAAMIQGMKQYVGLIESYRAINGVFPIPPGGTSNANTFACLGEGYTEPCVHENIGVTDVLTQPWLTTMLKQNSAHLPPLPSFVYWTDDNEMLKAGAFYKYAPPTNLIWMKHAKLQDAEAILVYYLEGNTASACAISAAIPKVFLGGDNTDVDIVTCTIPLGIHHFL